MTPFGSKRTKKEPRKTPSGRTGQFSKFLSFSKFDLCSDDVNFLGDGVDLLSNAGSSSQTTITQKCPGAIEIQKYHPRTAGPFRCSDSLHTGLHGCGGVKVEKTRR